MKKNVLKFASLALGLCVATALTSCHSGEEQEETTVINNVTQLEARTLFVHTNVSATVQGVGFNFSKTGENVEITNAPASGQFKVSADGRQTKTISFNFQDGAVLYFDIELVSAGKGVPQATAEAAPAGTVNNTDGSDNAEQTGVDASIDFNGATNTNASATGDYSITVFDPSTASTNAEDLAQGQTYLEAPLAISCTPSGATFSNPIKVSLDIPGSADFAVKVVNGDEEATVNQTGDVVVADIPHFSVWNIVLNVKLESIDTQVNKIVDTTVNAKSGKYGFKFDYGYSCDQASNSTLIKNLLKAMFGSKKKKVNKNITWTSTEGSATVTVNQEVKTYKFVSGNKVFYVTTYGKITSSVVVNPAEETPTHGGGSN